MKDVSLKIYNSFGIDANAKEFYNIYSEHDVYQVLTEVRPPYLVLGGGSNILLTKDVEVPVLKNSIKGIAVIDEDKDNILVEVGAGENWHNFVLWSISHNLYGLENLSLIPGSVGAAPIQNIGAYGVEQEKVFHSLKCISFEDGQTSVYYKSQCNFSYRNSIFKQDLKGKQIITRVRYLLPKHGELNLSYGAIKQFLAENSQPTITDVSNAVIAIRNSKLPNPINIPNSGSFFKNPIIGKSLHDELKMKFEKLVSYPLENNEFKVAAGWLIEQCGFKTREINGVKSHIDQALVLTRVSDISTGKDVHSYAKLIMEEVKTKFDILLEPEVNII